MKYSVLNFTKTQSIDLAQSLTKILRAGDAVLLDGVIGAGKTFFARAFIQSRFGYAEDVPSPTFTIVQTYEFDDLDVWHCDLYRLSGPDDAFELGLDEAFEHAICLIEWPDRLNDQLPPDALLLSFHIEDERRVLTIEGNNQWAERLSEVLGCV